MSSSRAGTAWSREENEILVADYLDALTLELDGVRFNKAERNRAMQKATGRTRGSIELKMPNISFVMRQLGLPIIDGYQPRSNVQAELYAVVQVQLGTRPELLRRIAAMTDEAPSPTIDRQALPKLVKAPRVVSEQPKIRRTADERKLRFFQFDYVARDSANRELGRQGELQVVSLEHRRLWQAGKRRLAEQIDHVSVSQGDGHGYDIRSFETSGRERLIEVKTTRLGLYTQFFVSANELSVSSECSDRYFLYRLCRFGRNPEYFILPGSLDSSCELTPTNYRASVR